MSSPATAAALLVCLTCGATFFAEYGCGGGSYCSEACELRPAAAPDDDDGYDGLDYENGDTHCVLARAGCDPDALPEAWRDEGVSAVKALRTARTARRLCVCGSTHTVLAREEVRQLRAAGYLVEVNRDDCGDYDHRDEMRDGDSAAEWHRREFVDEWRSPLEYLRGSFSAEDDVADWSLQEMEYEWLSAVLAEENEALGRLGFSLPSGFREFPPAEPPAEPPPAVACRRGADVVRVGAFVVRCDGACSVAHAHGGLVPECDGGFARSVDFGSREEAVAHAEACWGALLRGDPNPFRRTTGTAGGR